MARQIKITYESESLLILRGGYSQRAACSYCGAEVEVFALEETGLVTNLNWNALEQWLNSGEIHRLEANDGSTLLCLNSLLAKLNGQQP